MNVILIPGFLSPPCVLKPLRERLVAAGHRTHGPGFKLTTLRPGNLRALLAKLEEIGPSAVVGHSAGGLLAVCAAKARPDLVRVVVGLGSPVFGDVEVKRPYYEARARYGIDRLFPTRGPSIRYFDTTHVLLPLSKEVQNWVASNLAVREVKR